MPVKIPAYKKEQDKFRKLAAPKFHPKGEVIKVVNREGKKVEFANKAGEHMVQIGGKIAMVSRKVAKRRGGVDRSKNKKGAAHKVNPPKPIPFESGTNKQRFQLRKQMRVEREAIEGRATNDLHQIKER